MLPAEPQFQSARSTLRGGTSKFATLQCDASHEVGQMLSISTIAQRSGAGRGRKVFAATPSRVLVQRGWLTLFCLILAVFALMPLVALVLRGFLESQDGRTVLSFDALRTV